VFQMHFVHLEHNKRIFSRAASPRELSATDYYGHKSTTYL